MNRRYLYLLLLCLLAIITYLDRVCISVAGPRMQDALHISPERWGLVGTVFLLGYSLFEIPSGHLGDTLGARRVLTRIVLWWSAFTALTGAVSAYPVLLVVRFLFGAGEAGAFPNAGVAISSWFPIQTRGKAFGLIIMCTQLGGALSPLIVIPIQQAYGWRSSFFVFGLLGLLWAIVWFSQFRDRDTGGPRRAKPENKSWRPILKSVAAKRCSARQGQQPPSPRAVRCPRLLRNRSLWAIMGVAFGYVYTMSFYQTWFHTYLVKGRGFSEDALSLSALPYLFGAVANLLGGLICDWLAPRVGVKWSRRGVGIAGLLLAAVSLVCVLFAGSHLSVVACLSLTYAGITFQQPVVFITCLDIGGVRSGAISGFMNTAGQLGGALSSALFGFLVRAFGTYDAPLIPMVLLLAVGMLLWGWVDVTSQSEISGG